MSKVMLVIDEPESCFKCPCFDSEYEPSCKIEKYSTDGWCPLKPLPQKYEYYDLNEQPEEILANYEARGWNACINEITGETE